MRPFLALTLLAVLGFVFAGCGAAKKVAGLSMGGLGNPVLTVSGMMTINEQAGTDVACKSGPVTMVPGPGGRSVAPTDRRGNPTWSKAGYRIQITNPQNGPITVSCTSSH